MASPGRIAPTNSVAAFFTAGSAAVMLAVVSSSNAHERLLELGSNT